MKKILRIFIIILLIALLLVGSALAVGFVNPRAYEGMLNKLVYKKTGYQYSTTDLSIQLSPTIITIDGLKLSNPDWANDPKLLELGNAVITLNVKQLFNKQLPFWSAELKGAVVKIVENEEGQKNWNTSVLGSQSNQSGQKDEQPLDFKSLLSFSKSVLIKQSYVK